MARKRARHTGGGTSYPLWLGLLAVGGLSLLYSRSGTGDGPMSEESAPGSAASSAAASSGGPASDSPPLLAPVLTWRTEGTPDLPTPPELLGCLVRFGGRTPTLSASRAGGQFATDVTWLGPTVLQRIERVGPGEPPGRRARTQVGARPHAALAAHLALGACLRPGSETLVDVDLGRRFSQAQWPAPQPDGAVDVLALFGIEARADALVSRGMSRLGLPDLAVQPGAGGMETARGRLLRAISAAIVSERLGDSLALDDNAVPLTPFGGSRDILLVGGSRTPGTAEVHRASPQRDRLAPSAPPSAPPKPSGPAWKPASLPDYR